MYHVAVVLPVDGMTSPYAENSKKSYNMSNKPCLLGFATNCSENVIMMSKVGGYVIKIKTMCYNYTKL